MRTPTTIGAGCLAKSGNQVLLVQPNYGPAKGQWMFPGGYINANEAPEEAALRELHEETGQVGKILRPHCIRHRLNPSDLYWVFEVSLEKKLPLDILTSELDDARYWSIDEALASPLVRPMTQYFLATWVLPPNLRPPLPDGYDDTHRVFFLHPSAPVMPKLSNHPQRTPL